MEKQEIKYKGLDPYEGINFVERRALIKDKNGKIIFDELVEFPDFFSDDAVNIVSSKYLCNEAKHKETSLKQMIDRVSETIANWGLKDGYFGNDFDDNENYYEFLYKLKYYQINQYCAFNSPVYFNCGLSSDKPLLSACHILDIEDDMDSIYETIKLESMIFKNGAGSGMNMSKLRSCRELVRLGGMASGPVSFLRASDVSAGVIKSGGTLRRSAKLVCLNDDHPDVQKFIHCKELEEFKLKILKENGIESEEGYELSDNVFYQNTNISVRLSDDFMKAVENDRDWKTKYILTGEVCDTIKAKNLLKEISELAWRTGDPGVQFSDNINKWNTCSNSGEIMSTNPCVTGDTLVAVADGREFVTFKQLSDEDKDVPVYCLDKNKKLKIKFMRHPRITGHNKAIYRVTFDDGSYVRVTDNHKFVMKNGDIKETKDLINGDSLQTITKFKGNFDVIFKENKPTKSPNYNWLEANGKKYCEHRMIDEFYRGKNSPGYIVHHEDENGFNNVISNLKRMIKKDHDRFHADQRKGANNIMVRAHDEWSDEKWEIYRRNVSKATSGKNNGMYLGISNEEIKEHAIKLTNKLGRIFTTYDWREYVKENNIPEFRGISKWRKENLNGGIIGLSRWAAHKCGKEVLDHNQRTIRIYNDMLDKGYNPEIIDGCVYVHKICEDCGKDFLRHFHRRELCFCKSCSSRRSNVGKIISQKQREQIKKTSKKIWNTEEGKNSRRASAIASNKSVALSCGSMLLFLNENINKDTWDLYKPLLKENGIKRFIQKKIIDKYWDNDWNKFVEDCKSYNHKVVTVDLDGCEDVYNGTVDDFHNMFIMDGNCIGKSLKTLVNVRNCGEFSWHNNSSCNLASINILKLFVKENNSEDIGFNLETFDNVIRIIVTAQDIIVSRGQYPSRKITTNSYNFRPIGLGYSNLGSLLMTLGLPYDSEEGRNIAALLTASMIGSAFKISNELAISIGAFQKFEENIDPYYNVLNKHKECMYELLSRTTNVYSRRSNIINKLSNNVKDISNKLKYFIENKSKFRNSQVTLLAPTGTISFLMDCPTRGIEPDYSLVSYKTLSGSGGATIKMINPIVKESLKNLGYLDSEIEILYDELHSLGHFEKSEILKKEHLPIFDTAGIPQGGNRSIDYMGHVKMVASVQPFLSGSVSKTINLSNSATVEDIYNLYLESWKMGIKGITVYRDGSKTYQPLNTHKKEEGNIIKNSSRKIGMPSTRPGEIHKFSIGSTEGYLMTGLYDNGDLGETFLTVAKQGSTLSGLLDMLAIMISISLQHGVPLKTIVTKLMFSRFDPSGITSNPDIRFATSICDYLGRYLGNKYLSEEDKSELGLKKQDNRNDGLEEFEEISIINNVIDNGDAPVCDCCGGMMQRVGTCFNCNNCGANSGACG